MIISCGIDLPIELNHPDSLALTSKLPSLIFTVAVEGDLTTATHSLSHTHTQPALSQTGYAAEMYQLYFPDPLYQHSCAQCLRKHSVSPLWYRREFG